jgi:hypothetical protein
MWWNYNSFIYIKPIVLYYITSFLP